MKGPVVALYKVLLYKASSLPLLTEQDYQSPPTLMAVMPQRQTRKGKFYWSIRTCLFEGISFENGHYNKDFLF